MDVRHLKHIISPYCVNSDNKRYDICVKNITIPIYVFYHIYCGPNSYKEILLEQLEVMRKSGLYDIMSRIYVTVIGDNEDREYVKQQFPFDRLYVTYESTDGSCYEFPTLRIMQEIALKEKFYALYFHTKGSSYTKATYDGKYVYDYESVHKNIVAWRHLMNYYNLTKWNMAINALSDGYKTYGCLLMEPHSSITKWHYSGNFWWSTSENIKNSPCLNLNIVKNRWEAELWSVNDGDKAYCTFFCYVLLYGAKIYDSTYLKPWWNLENIKYAVYHFFIGRKHLLY